MCVSDLFVCVHACVHACVCMHVCMRVCACVWLSLCVGISVSMCICLYIGFCHCLLQIAIFSYTCIVHVKYCLGFSDTCLYYDFTNYVRIR